MVYKYDAVFDGLFYMDADFLCLTEKPPPKPRTFSRSPNRLTIASVTDFRFARFIIGHLIKVYSATTICYLNIPEWSDEWQEKMIFLQDEFLQDEFEYFKGLGKIRQGEFDYPQVD